MEVCTDTKRSFFSRRIYIPTVDRGALHGQTLDDAITCDCTRACMEGAVCVRARRKEWLVLCHIIKNEWNKWKNHFYEMKGDVGINVTS